MIRGRSLCGSITHSPLDAGRTILPALPFLRTAAECAVNGRRLDRAGGIR